MIKLKKRLYEGVFFEALNELYNEKLPLKEAQMLYQIRKKYMDSAKEYYDTQNKIFKDAGVEPQEDGSMFITKEDERYEDITTAVNELREQEVDTGVKEKLTLPDTVSLTAAHYAVLKETILA